MTLSDIISLIALGFSIWVWYAQRGADKRLRGLEREEKRTDRQREFIAFMQHLISEAEIHRHMEDFPVWLQQKIPDLKRAKAIIVGDLTDDQAARLDKMISDITASAHPVKREWRIQTLREIADLVNNI